MAPVKAGLPTPTAYNMLAQKNKNKNKKKKKPHQASEKCC
jgi:hypothetical protein